MTRTLFTLSVLLLSQAIPAAHAAESRTELRDRRYPYIQTARPMWGLELTGGFAFPAGAFSMGGGALRFEWQPPWTQAGGILSIGPTLDYTLGLLGGGIGGVVRYQARYFRNQPLVPYAGYTALYYISTASIATGLNQLTTSVVHGPFVGGQLFLNFFDDDSASEFFVDYGILRSYLVFELRFMQGVSPLLPTATSPAYYTGLRFEF